MVFYPDSIPFFHAIRYKVSQYRTVNPGPVVNVTITRYQPEKIEKSR